MRECRSTRDSQATEETKGRVRVTLAYMILLAHSDFPVLYLFFKVIIEIVEVF